MWYRQIVLYSVMILMLNGCFFGGGKSSLSAGRGEFPDVGLSFMLDGAPEDNQQKVIEFLSDRGLRFRIESQKDIHWLICAPLAEPLREGEKRIRRTSFLFTIRADSSQSPWSTGLVTWLVESKLPREEKWTSDPADAIYMPQQLEDVKRFFRRNRYQPEVTMSEEKPE